MKLNDELFERSKKVAPGGVHSPVRSFKGMNMSPIFFKGAKGTELEAVDGTRYTDFCMSFGPLILGHRDPDVSREVEEMIQTGWTFGACEPYSLALAEWITSRVPHVQKLRFVSSGTEAVMSAMRVARAGTGREKVLKFEGCYHGHVDSLLVKAGSGLAGESASSSAGISAKTASDTLVASLDDEAGLEKIFKERGHEIAVVAIEPLPANYGLLIQRKEFLQKVADLAKKYGALLLFDEVISGFRVGLGGMAEILQITPDLVCYGKILGGGFPVGCYGGRAELMDLVAPLGKVYQAGTLSANPVGMRAGLATLQKMEKLDGWKELERRGAAFEQKLSKELAGTPFQVSRYGSLFWLHNPTSSPIRDITQIAPSHGEHFAPFFRACLDRGIYLAPNAYEVGFLSLAHTDELLAHCAIKMGEAARATSRT